MKEMHYLEKGGMRIVPKYDGNAPGGFDIVDVVTGVGLAHRNTLYETEQFIADGLPNEKIPIEDMFKSAAEVEGY